MKGQIFTLDALLSLLILTVMIGLVTMQFELIYGHASDINYFEKQTLADDWSQIAVKNLLLEDNYSSSITNSKAALDLLNSTMRSGINTRLDFEIRLSTGEVRGSDSCGSSCTVASAVRYVPINGAAGNITVRICDA